MNRPSRRYYFALAERLGVTVKELLIKCDARELSEWLAYDLTCNDDWVKKYKMSKMTAEDTTNALMRLFKPRKKNGNDQ